MHFQNFENFGNECAKIKNQFLIFRKSICKIAGNPWKSILKSINQNAFFFSRVSLVFFFQYLWVHFNINKTDLPIYHYNIDLSSFGELLFYFFTFRIIWNKIYKKSFLEA
jgi:hypothetical protein